MYPYNVKQNIYIAFDGCYTIWFVEGQTHKNLTVLYCTVTYCIVRNKEIKRREQKGNNQRGLFPMVVTKGLPPGTKNLQKFTKSGSPAGKNRQSLLCTKNTGYTEYKK